jgi:hypothetical protein
MTQDLVAQSEKRNYGELFRYDLNWGAPDHQPVTLQLEDGTTLTATNVSSYKGLRVWEVPAFPGSAVEAQMDRLLSKTTTNRLVIFHADDKQAWRWPSRTSNGAGVVSRPARHVHRTGSNDPKFVDKLEAIRLPDDALLDVNAVLSKVRGAFDVESKNETKRASKLMARMYAAVEKAYSAGYDPKQRDHEISASLARVLFLLFGDDTEMWAPDLFQDFIKDHTARDGTDVGERLNELFGVLDMPPSTRVGLAAELSAFPYVNGGIFEETITLPTLDHEFRTAVLDAAAVDWSTISPAIFGSMFQSVRNAQTRRELGEHYTSEENILKTLNPLFLDELRAEFDAAKLKDTDRKRANAFNALWQRLGAIRFMDPACGCGNFIIVAYRELRAIELEVMLALQDLTGYSQLSFDPSLDLNVTLDHFYGIEVDEWPARIAETAMFLMDRQCDLRLKERFGEAPQRLPIQRQAKIVVGNALRLNWDDVCPPTADVVIAGNPPFLGDHTRTSEQKAELQAAWGDDTTLSRMDYVTGWYARAMQYFAHHDGLWAFVSTNSICQGDPVPRLFGPLFGSGWRIRFAHRTFAWTSEAAGVAAVHCVVIGFDRGRKNRPRLFDYAHLKAQPEEVPNVNQINAYLVDGPNVLVTKRTNPINSELTTPGYGSKPSDGGHLVVTPEQLQSVAADPIAARYLRPYIGSEELLNGKQRWCLWLLDAPANDLTTSPVLRERIEGVRVSRLDSKAPSTRQKAAISHLFGQRAPVPDVPVLAIPEVSSENRDFIPVAHLEAGTIVSNKVYSTADPTGFLFAIASSSMMITWQRTVGGRMKSDLSFSNTIVWNNFPLPPVPRDLHRAIVEAGEKVLIARAQVPGATLAKLYEPLRMHAALRQAHVELDRLVDAAFGIREEHPSELHRQEALFAHYLALTS